MLRFLAINKLLFGLIEFYFSLQFIALFDYDPYKSSPNQNPSLELQFNEGDLLKVYDTSRSDGFYHAEVMQSFFFTYISLKQKHGCMIASEEHFKETL